MLMFVLRETLLVEVRSELNNTKKRQIMKCQRLIETIQSQQENYSA